MSVSDADILQIDRNYEIAMERANHAFMSALRGEMSMPRRVYWSGVTTTTWNGTASTARHRESAVRVAEHIAAKAKIDSLRVVDRDPCAGCGVRGEQHAAMGCKTFRRAA